MLSTLLTLPLALAVLEPITAHAPEQDTTQKVLRVGMIGLDTSHVSAFGKILNDAAAKPDVARCSVVAAYPPGSDLPFALERRKKYTAELAGWGVEMVDSIPELLTKVDVVMLMTVDGRPHLEQALPVLRAGKPLFIDKPLAGSLADAISIVQVAERLGVPLFTSSSLRYTDGARAARAGEYGDVIGADAYGPCTLEEHHPDLYWYGIHGVELLYTAMGTGCESVVRSSTEGTDVVTGTWSNGRLGTFRGIRDGKSGYGGTVFGTKAIAQLGPYGGYRPLVAEIVRFFRSGESPVDVAESLEIFTFMEAADESKRRGGVPVMLADVLERARGEARSRLQKLNAARPR